MREEDMMIRSRNIISLFIACLLGVTMFVFSQNASALFEQGLMKENAEGDLPGAIAVFTRVIDDKTADPSIRAKAQLHIGMCYEKLGQTEARAAYQKVIDNYPQQRQEVASARERMARLGKDAFSPTFRKIHIANTLMPDAQLSPDGISIALVNNGWLWIVPASSNVGPGYAGAPRQLDTKEIKADWPGFTWSGDGQWIAFNGAEITEGRQKIYVVPAAGGKPREIYENNRGALAVNYRMSLSPHGETIAFSNVDAGEFHIYKMPVAGGTLQRLVDAPAREPVFSPDGKMIAFVEDKLMGREGGGLWVVPVENGSPTLVADAGNATSPIWSPDGKMIVFLDSGANNKIHIVRVSPDGKAIGEKISIEFPEGIGGAGRLTGWTANNKIGILVGTPSDSALYTQPLEGGKATLIAHGGYPVQPRWSPDGKRIFHVNEVTETNEDWVSFAIASVPSQGGSISTVPLHSKVKIRLQAWGTGNRVSPDGRTLVFAGHKEQAPIPTMHIWTLPVDGGMPRQLTDAPQGYRDLYPCWSPDGREIAFVRWKMNAKGNEFEGNIYVIPADGGEPRRITSDSDRVYGAGPAWWLPDGTFFAYCSQEESDTELAVKVIPADGGQPRIVAEVPYAAEIAWSPDGRRIAYHEKSNKIKILSLSDEHIEEIMPDIINVKGIYQLDWSPDGKTLVFGGITGGDRELWMMEDFLPLVTQ
jgi:Tol biopolymer transport system component